MVFVWAQGPLYDCGEASDGCRDVDAGSVDSNKVVVVEMASYVEVRFVDVYFH